MCPYLALTLGKINARKCYIYFLSEIESVILQRLKTSKKQLKIFINSRILNTSRTNLTTPSTLHNDQLDPSTDAYFTGVCQYIHV